MVAEPHPKPIGVGAYLTSTIAVPPSPFCTAGTSRVTLVDVVPTTSSTAWAGGGTKSTDAVWFDVIDTVHVVDVPADAHAPPQPPTCQPLAGLAVSVTLVPSWNVPVSFVVLVFVVIPDGLELTLPDPTWLKLSVRGACTKFTDAV